MLGGGKFGDVAASQAGLWPGGGVAPVLVPGWQGARVAGCPGGRVPGWQADGWGYDERADPLEWGSALVVAGDRQLVAE
ncbi:hypothetical protein Vqi01_08420 [Micromonospora qiuiae]|uniref:Uncharacterized protein n=1 Tax=Micromonospora qiuiae TaxID=502268 RepID=A0ABQ4J681_9ACTN|nr:hypothetical protein Vqi01_08420 [Micromonospora qiuiae]